ncbi:kinase-like domain-containing protein [Globomyces pollinis-pini]|nr:kinase-like domain-containing protein [Globomyces pollinis-pini]
MDKGKQIKETLDATCSIENGTRILNQYVLKKQLGSGSFGTVYLAEDTDLKIKVAIKECSKSKLRKQRNQESGGGIGGRGRGRGRGVKASVSRRVTVNIRNNNLPPASNAIDLVRGEIAILKKLNHKNIVRLYEVLDDPKQDSIFMAYELCEKGVAINLVENATVDPLPLDVARKYFQQLILGIEYLHECGIAHRDIKPDNMLISSDGTVKIVDFGVSEMFSKGNDKFKKTAGSPAFYAPEYCNLSHGDLSAMAADIWAMGVTLYSMVFGKIPFTGKSIIQLFDNIRDTEPVYPSDIEPRLKVVLTKLLEKDPEKRITMEELRIDPWVTDSGKTPLIPFEENCVVKVIEITQSDIEAAVKPIRSIFVVLKAVSKWKQLVLKNRKLRAAKPKTS